MLPRLKTGCCGSSLHTASLVIAWLQVMLSALCVLLFCFIGSVMIEILMKNNLPQENSENIDPQLIAIIVGVMIAITSIGLFVCLGLLIGIYKRNYCIMMPYLIIAGFNNILNIITGVVLFFTAFSEPVIFVQFLLHVCFTAFTCYCWLILYAHFQEIKTTALANQNEFQKV